MIREMESNFLTMLLIRTICVVTQGAHTPTFALITMEQTTKMREIWKEIWFSVETRNFVSHWKLRLAAI